MGSITAGRIGNCGDYSSMQVPMLLRQINSVGERHLNYTWLDALKFSVDQFHDHLCRKLRLMSSAQEELGGSAVITP